MTLTKQQLLAEKPSSTVSDSTFKLVTKDLSPSASQVLVKVLYLSNDPAQKTWIQKGADPARAYMPLPDEGDVMPARALCSVVQVGADVKDFKAGDKVLASSGWTEYAVVEAQGLQRAQVLADYPDTVNLSILGTTGLTAYYGLLKVGKATSEDSCIVVSGAAGATGSVVVQIAKKVLGIAKVIGLAGSVDKCQWVETLGADTCINYKDKDWRAQLESATASKADLYFDNVGGEILDEMLLRTRRHGRIVACGAISSYNSMEQGTVLKNYFEVISNRLCVQGFIVIDCYMSGKAGEYVQELASWISQGKIVLQKGKSETILEATMDQVPHVWAELFKGGNSGKLITKLIHENDSTV